MPLLFAPPADPALTLTCLRPLQVLLFFCFSELYQVTEDLVKATGRVTEWGGGPPTSSAGEDGAGEGEGEMIPVRQQRAVRLA